MGVDVMRWLYCAHKPENNLLFGYERADDVRRRFLIPLWNIYSFFSTYACLDHWEPEWGTFDPSHPEGFPPSSHNLLDRWILARVNQMVQRVTGSLDNYDAYAATLAIEPFIDDLTNWYVRRSRRRFWRSEQDADKNSAYATLYYVLVKLTRTLAPFIPFVTEVMYQNLVCSARSDAFASVHHTMWPEPNPTVVDERLVNQMTRARRVASLGLSARSNAGLKVRQPLSKVLVHIKGRAAELNDDLIAIVADELNIKTFEFVQNAEPLIAYRILPNSSQFGPKFGSKFPLIRTALSELDAAEVARKVGANEPVRLTVEGELIELSAEEILVETRPAEGLAVAAEADMIVAIETIITEELELEGYARELVRHIQQLRKDAGFDISDRIVTHVAGMHAIHAMLDKFGPYVKTETLTVDLVRMDIEENFSVPEALSSASFTLGGQAVGRCGQITLDPLLSFIGAAGKGRDADESDP